MCLMKNAFYLLKLNKKLYCVAETFLEQNILIKTVSNYLSLKSEEEKFMITHPLHDETSYVLMMLKT